MEAGRLPTFVVPGAMKAGTSSLSRYLGAHPQVHMSPRKELHFFDRQHGRGIEWYRRQFSRAGDALAVGEATPAYFRVPGALERMAQALPEARIVVLLRNPVDRAYSHYWHNVSRGREARPFEESSRDPASRYLTTSRYVEPLHELERLYGRTQLHVVLFEDLRDEPRPTYAGVCRFLGVDDDVVPDILGRVVNQHARFRSLRLRDLGRRLPKKMGNAIGKVNRRVEPYPRLDPATRQLLEDLFADDVAELSTWLGRDLSFWTSSSATDATS